VAGRGSPYIGRAGQFAVMAEFLMRGWNVAVPEVDVGDDVFVVRDSDGDLSRIQVKTARARPTTAGYNVTFSVPTLQLETARTPELFYVVAVRSDARWSEFVVIPRAALYDLQETRSIGTRL
jgi:hypothetical protein